MSLLKCLMFWDFIGSVCPTCVKLKRLLFDKTHLSLMAISGALKITKRVSKLQLITNVVHENNINFIVYFKQSEVQIDI